ncbi:unnamed protein product [Ectocarpus fasciculatus]
MPTEAFPVALAPWLGIAAEPETNPVVFRKTIEGVFEGLLGLFPQDEDGMEAEEEEKVFGAVEIDRVQACLFEVAAAPQVTKNERLSFCLKQHSLGRASPRDLQLEPAQCGMNV